MKGITMHAMTVRSVATAGLMCCANSAYAHVGFGPTVGFSNGLLHPIFGIDHLLAMIMVGTFAAQLGGRALFLVPASFVGSMAIGAALGVFGFKFGLAEFGIASSVFTLGAIVACRSHLGLISAMTLVALFGLCHGHSHGTEMPESVNGLAYAAGFMLMTAALHAAGISIGLLITRITGRYGDVVMRSLGAGVALVGAGLMAVAM